jgi:mitochondrial fusion and transport protein UGO1
MSTDGPASLRDLYKTPNSSSAWTFPATNSSPSSAANASSVVFPAPPARRVASQNSIFELSPSLLDSSSSSTENVDLKLLARTVVASVVLQYATTAIAMPWEVGKCLLQVQWVPRDVGERVDEKEEEEEEEAVVEEVRYFILLLLFLRQLFIYGVVERR